MVVLMPLGHAYKLMGKTVCNPTSSINLACRVQEKAAQQQGVCRSYGLWHIKAFSHTISGGYKETQPRSRRRWLPCYQIFGWNVNVF